MKVISLSLLAIIMNLSLYGQTIQHVIIIGIDGMSPNGILNANSPVMDNLMQNGSYTMHARDVLPSSSSPNWASMIMGAGPEQHGITSNEWQPDNHILPPVIKNEAGYFPTIFWLLYQHNPGYEIGAIYHWDDFGRLFEKEAVDFDTTFKNENKVADMASQYIVDNKPNFLFVHFDHVDGAGHKFGHGTEKYYGSVAKADQLIGKIADAIKTADLMDKTLIIISSDHGGNGTSHGGETPGEVEIPIILSGPGIKQGYEITYPVNIYDIASTVAYVFNLEQPRAWIGRPITSAFIE